MRRRCALPTLWLFTDPVRTPDLERAVRALPPRLCGVVFRHDGVSGRAALLRKVALLCRARQIPLLVAADSKPLPPGAGRHLRAGRGPSVPGAFLTSSAHGAAELVRARRAGAMLAFLSPAFATKTHPSALPLGPVRWAKLARTAAIPVLALGGITGRTARRLPTWVHGAGAIGGLAP